MTKIRLDGFVDKTTGQWVSPGDMPMQEVQLYAKGRNNFYAVSVDDNGALVVRASRAVSLELDSANTFRVKIIDPR